MIEACKEVDGDIRWYVFGSVLQNQQSPSDIDILCISPDPQTCCRVRSRCADFLLNAPIHLRLLTNQQEQALKFIERTDALDLARITDNPAKA